MFSRSRSFGAITPQQLDGWRLETGETSWPTQPRSDRTLVGAPGIATSNKKLLGAPGLTTRSKDATRALYSTVFFASTLKCGHRLIHTQQETQPTGKCFAFLDSERSCVPERMAATFAFFRSWRENELGAMPAKAFASHQAKRASLLGARTLLGGSWPYY